MGSVGDGSLDPLMSDGTSGPQAAADESGWANFSPKRRLRRNRLD
jgi:hypothetical protein